MCQEIWRVLREESVRICNVLCLLVSLMAPCALIAGGDTSQYSVTIAYAPGASVARGAEVLLDIHVKNLSAKQSDDWFAAVVFDFTSAHLTPLDCGVLPPDWQGVLTGC
jgi:hypothetical protein